MGVTGTANTIWPSLAAFVLWLLVGFSVVVWVLRVAQSNQALPALVASAAAEAAGGAPEKFLGAAAQSADAAPASVTPEAQWLASARLLGIVSGGRSQSLALIGLANQTARPFAVGQEVAAGIFLARVLEDGALFKNAQGREIGKLTLPQSAAEGARSGQANTNSAAPLPQSVPAAPPSLAESIAASRGAPPGQAPGGMPPGVMP